MSKGLKKAAPGLALQPKSTVSPPSFTVSSISRDAISSILTCIRWLPHLPTPRLGSACDRGAERVSCGIGGLAQ